MTSRVAVVGGGSLGLLFAAWLVEAGTDTVLCARSAVPEVVLEQGGRESRPQVPVVYDPSELGDDPVDVVLVTTKAQDTAAAADWLAALVTSRTVVVLVQNGVDHARRVAGLVPPEQVLPAIAYISSERTAPGRVHHFYGHGLMVPAGPLAERLVDAVGSSELKVDDTDDFLTASWQKLLGNLANNSLTALTTGRMQVFDDAPDLREVAHALLEEAVAVGCAEGAALGPQSIEAVSELRRRLAPDNGTSMLYDRLAGRPLEHEHLTGAVVAAADRHGIPAPVNRTLLALLRGLDASLARGRAAG